MTPTEKPESFAATARAIVAALVVEILGAACAKTWMPGSGATGSLLGEHRSRHD